MLTIKTFQVGPISENCYVVSDDTNEAVIIDCGCFTDSEWKSIRRYCDDNELKVVRMLNTHFHFDHMMGILFAYPDIRIPFDGNYADEYLYKSLGEQIESFLGIDMACDNLPPMGKNMSEGTEVKFGSHTFTVIQTPGHTPGGVCYYCKEEDVLFSGDTLFQCSMGRTDLPGGNGHEMSASLRRLSTLPRETRVYPGHGGWTEIGYECDNNPYF